MAKLSEKYEAIIVFSLKKTEDEIKALTAKFADLIKANGTLTNIDEWGKRKLAYEIQKMREGFYYFVRFESDAACPAEVEKRVRIMENVIRYLCVRQDA